MGVVGLFLTPKSWTVEKTNVDDEEGRRNYGSGLSANESGCCGIN